MSPNTAAAPATVSGESSVICPLGFGSREGDGRWRPASQETCRQPWSYASAAGRGVLAVGEPIILIGCAGTLEFAVTCHRACYPRCLRVCGHHPCARRRPICTFIDSIILALHPACCRAEAGSAAHPRYRSGGAASWSGDGIAPVGIGGVSGLRPLCKCLGHSRHSPPSSAPPAAANPPVAAQGGSTTLPTIQVTAPHAKPRVTRAKPAQVAAPSATTRPRRRRLTRPVRPTLQAARRWCRNWRAR